MPSDDEEFLIGLRITRMKAKQDGKVLWNLEVVEGKDREFPGPDLARIGMMAIKYGVHILDRAMAGTDLYHVEPGS